MQTLPIIAHLDVAGNVLLRFLPGWIDGTMDPLDFHRRVERLSQRVIKANAGAAHGLAYPEALQDGGELSGGVIAAAVGVKHRTLRQANVAGGHLDRRADQRSLVII